MIFAGLVSGFSQIFQFETFTAVLMGCFFGTLTGLIPGIGPTATMSLLLPITFGMSPIAGMVMYCAIFDGAMFAGKTGAILINVPGEGAAVISCLEGYPMGQKGRAGAAMAIGTCSSFWGTCVGATFLMLVAPPMARFALRFGPAEYFGLTLFGLFVLCNLVGKDTKRSLVMAFLGIVISTFGIDPVSSFSRFSFGITELQRGIPFVIVAMGALGLAEVLTTITKPMEAMKIHKLRFRDMYPTRDEIRRSVKPACRGSIIGFLSGLIPGPSTVIATFISYAAEKRLSKTPELFGTGMVEGLAGPEAANNAATNGAMVPLLALGIPFSSTTALMLTGLMIHGITPGPNFIAQHQNIFWVIIASMFVANCILWIMNLPMIGIFTSVLRIPLQILMPLVSIIILSGGYTISYSVFEMRVLIFMGVLGYLLRKTEYEATPLVVGIILGRTMETGLRQGLLINRGSFAAMLSRPIVAGFVIMSLAVILLQFYSSIKKRREGKEKTFFSED